MADITELPAAGLRCLAAIVDARSRRVVGWALNERARASLGGQAVMPWRVSWAADVRR